MSSKVTWKKVEEVYSVRANARVKPSPYLEVRVGKYKTSFRINFRQGGIELRETLVGDFKGWEDANTRVEELVAKAKYGERKTPVDELRNEEIAQQLIEESKSQDEATQYSKRNTYEKHLVPWFNEFCPYASQLTVASFPQYKAFKRAENPTVALENHYKYFAMLCNRAFDLGAIKRRIRVKFDVKKEDFREDGRVFEPAQLIAMLEAAPSVSMSWHDRIVIQAETGMRPGDVRKLRKKPTPHPREPGRMLPANVELSSVEKRSGDGANVSVDAIIVRLQEEDTKTHRYREFLVTSPRAVHAIKWRMEAAKFADSPFLFPQETDHMKAMDKHLNGWNSILRKSKVDPQAGISGHSGFTPHDLRHTYATRMFKATNEWAGLCYQLDMSLEMAQGTYIHFQAKDTRAIAEIAAGTLDNKPNAATPEGQQC